MAVTHCPKCEKTISDSVPTCSHCGHVVAPDKARTTRLLLRAYNIGCLAILALLTGAFVYWLIGILR